MDRKLKQLEELLEEISEELEECVEEEEENYAEYLQDISDEAYEYNDDGEYIGIRFTLSPEFLKERFPDQFLDEYEIIIDTTEGAEIIGKYNDKEVTVDMSEELVSVINFFFEESVKLHEEDDREDSKNNEVSLEGLLNNIVSDMQNLVKLNRENELRDYYNDLAGLVEHKQCGKLVGVEFKINNVELCCRFGHSYMFGYEVIVDTMNKVLKGVHNSEKISVEIPNELVFWINDYFEQDVA